MGNFPASRVLDAKLQSFMVIIYCWLSNIFTACRYTVFHGFAVIRRQNYLNIQLSLYTVPAARSRGVDYRAVLL